MNTEIKSTKEIWKDIPEFKGYYQASNLGRIRSLDRIVNTLYGNRLVKGKIMVLHVCNNYLQVTVSKEGKEYNRRVNRLVGQAFLPNPKNLPIINHKNEVKTDNSVDNLEWCTHKYNLNYNQPIRRVLGKKVYKYDLNGNFLNEYDSFTEASEQEDKLCKGQISKCVKGKIKTHGGFIWSGEKMH